MIIIDLFETKTLLFRIKIVATNLKDMNSYNPKHYDKKLSSSQILLIILGMIVLTALLILKLTGNIAL